MLTCPRCNASFAPANTIAQGEKVLCPRCDETFASPTDFVSATTQTPSTQASSPTSPVPVPRRWSNRTVLGFVLLFMLGMASVGFAFMWFTVSARRANDTVKPGRAEMLRLAPFERVLLVGYLAVVTVLTVRSWRLRRRSERTQSETLLHLIVPSVLTGLGGVMLLAVFRNRPERDIEELPAEPIVVKAPAELLALSYLPAEVEFLVGLHISECSQIPLAQETLSKLRLGKSELTLETFTRWTGLAPDELDHLVIGVQVSKTLIPAFTLVLHTRRNVSLLHLGKELQLGKITDVSGKKLYECKLKLGEVSLPAQLWQAEAQTLVWFVNVDTERMRAVPNQPLAGKSLVPTKLQALLADRQTFDKGTQLWLVADLAGWQQGEWWSPLQLLPEPVRALSKPVQQASLAGRFTESLSLRAHFHCANSEAAQKFTDALSKRGQQPTREEAKVILQGEVPAEDLQRALGETHLKAKE